MLRGDVEHAVGYRVIIGILDDLIGIEPWHKLIGQIIAGGLAYWAGIHVQGFGGYNLGPWWSIPLTILWLVGCTNAINLIDGIDGLATGVALFATCTTLIAALLQHNLALALAVVPLAGCLLGFLRYNFNPATIFLGDSGSLFIGFLLGYFSVLWSQKAATMLGMTAPLIALSVPLLDTGLAIFRRFLRRQPIFGADPRPHSSPSPRQGSDSAESRSHFVRLFRRGRRVLSFDHEQERLGSGSSDLLSYELDRRTAPGLHRVCQKIAGEAHLHDHVKLEVQPRDIIVTRQAGRRAGRL